LGKKRTFDLIKISALWSSLRNLVYKFIVLAASKEPVSFFEFSGLFLNKYNSRNALCLESAAVVMNMPYLSQIAYDKDLAICRYLGSA
jgi:hypothetical protein